MKRILLALLLSTSVSAAPALAADPPLWAFPVGQAYVAPPPETGEQLKVPNSDKSFTRTQLRNIFSVPDWHPESHPPMPDVVAKGKAPKLWACGYCHLPTGQGRPENSSLAGLDQGYMIQQVLDIKEGKRKVSQPKMEPLVRMHEAAEAVSLEDLKTATEYFASLKYKPWIKVVETDKVPQTKIMAMYVPLEGNETEKLGDRIIEVPEKPDLTDIRDFQTGFIAYVPKGAVKRGEKLAKKGVNGGAPCATCHGPDYKGLGPVPTLAGRSPTYTGRQLWNLREGFRQGSWSALMMQTVFELKDKEIIDLAAYFASLKP